MTPPAQIATGRFVRFPGIGKGRGNTAGWCRVITPTLAVYGDWSTDLRAVWHDGSIDPAQARRALREALRSQRDERRRQAAEQRRRAEEAAALIGRAAVATHSYLTAKGFPSLPGLVLDGDLLVPMRDAGNYERIVNVQRIKSDGTKRFLPGARARGAIHRIGHQGGSVWLCEGYATGLSIAMALDRLSGRHAVIICFSAHNLLYVSRRFPQATVCADHDESQTGERIARETGLRWVMPEKLGDDFNDLHQREGIFAVVQALRQATGVSA